MLSKTAAAESIAISFRRIGLASLILVVVLGYCIVGPRAAEQTPKLQVLFIGNSFTYYHDLPRMVAELAKAGGQRPIAFESETPGGCTLEKHWQDHKALALIQSRRWDYVVLQDQSQAPLLNRAAMFQYGKLFDREIRKQGAATVLYMTWAVRNKPEQQAPISKAYATLAGELHSRLAPVGNAWQAALAADKRLVLHDADKKHPNPAGTYLAACVFYSTIYGKSPEGLPGSIGGLTDATARALQTSAWKSVQAAMGREPIMLRSGKPRSPATWSRAFQGSSGYSSLDTAF